MARPSYVHGTSEIPLLGMTIGESLRSTAERFPDREAAVVRWQGWRATWNELWDQTTVLARALMASGVGKGDRVGMWSPNRFEWIVVQFATARVGAILVNVNPAYRASELEYALNQSGCRLLVAADRFLTSDYVAMVDQVAPQLPTLENLLNALVSTCSMEKAYLFDVVSKLYISTDSSPVDMQSVELCSDMIDVVLDVSGIYGRGPSNTTNNLAAAEPPQIENDPKDELVGTLISQAPMEETAEDLVDPDTAYDNESASVIRLSNGVVSGLSRVEVVVVPSSVSLGFPRFCT